MCRGFESLLRYQKSYYNQLFGAEPAIAAPEGPPYAQCHSGATRSVRFLCACDRPTQPSAPGFLRLSGGVSETGSATRRLKNRSDGLRIATLYLTRRQRTALGIFVTKPRLRLPGTPGNLLKSSGWGTWIRTKINGVRVRCSTVELSPNGGARITQRGASDGLESAAKAVNYRGPGLLCAAIAARPRGSARL